MSNRCKVIVLFFSIFFLNLTRGVSQTIENNKDNNKSSIELIKDIERIIHSLEEKDSLNISAYVDYCIDSIICQETDVMRKFQLLIYVCNDDFLKNLSLSQKNRLIDEILKGRFYDPCVSGYGFDSVIWDLPFCSFLIKNESDKIRDSIRKAEIELSQSACDNCTVEEHKLFYRNFLLSLHDNRTIDWLFKNLIDASQSNKRIDTDDFLIIPFDLEWFKYRKEEVFEVLCDVIRTNKNAYVKYQWYSYDDGDYNIFYHSLEFCLITNIDKFIEEFPELEDTDDIIIQKYKGKNFRTFSEKYKQRVIKWMEKHKSDYVYKKNESN